METDKKIDLFTPVHKGIRNLIYAMGAQLQLVDFTNLVDGDQLLDHLEEMLSLLKDHADHEDRIIFPHIDSVAPGAASELEMQHDQGELKLEALSGHIDNMRAADLQERVLLSRELSIYFTDFIAFYLWHMNREEETLLPLSQKLLANEQLSGIRTKIQISIPTDRYRKWLRWMLPAFNLAELSDFYGQVKQHAPHHVNELIVEIAEQYIDPARWSQIREYPVIND